MLAPSTRSSRFALAALALVVSACGGDDGGPLDVITDADRIAAARAVAEQASGVCADVRPFYWEIGDASGARISGSVTAPGNNTVINAQTQMVIASATKWLYGAYVAERRNGALTSEDISFLSFRSGYTSFAAGGCENADSVAGCANRAPSGVRTDAHVGRFYYDGAHMQQHASLPAPGMALGGLVNATLADEMRRVLGTELVLTFTQPQLAGGARTNAASYAIFLRKILNNQLRIADLLGAHATCTNPLTCPTAIATPISGAYSWHYGIGHWIEDDPVAGDSAFSSAGAFGFYPWVSADKAWYGVLARLAAPGSGESSAICGGAIRRAWVTGVVR